MGLKPLEFVDCLSDSPYFRENLHVYEKELERTSKSIKGLVAECKGLLQAAQNLSEAQKKFSDTLQKFEFNCIEGEQTEDEKVIAGSLKQFGKLISTIEEARARMLACAQDRIITPLEIFRKEHIGGAREERKKFDKLTAKFYQSQERNLNLKTKNSNTDAVKEDDNELVLKRGSFYRASMQYVLLLQEVQERKKFEFVETLLGFMYSWLTFYHEGHEVHNEFKPFTTELQMRLQKCRENFKTAHEQAEQLMNRMLEVRGTKPQIENSSHHHRGCTKEGYLYLMEKKALGTTSWNKHYCEYYKTGKQLKLTQYNPTKPGPIETLDMLLLSCTRRASDSIEKRFCFDITVSERSEPLTFQAVSQEDMQLWLDAMDGKEPIYEQPSTSADSDSSLLDDIGFNFIRRCIYAIERRGLDDQGIYRVVGVNSKVTKLLNLGLNRKKCDKLNMDDPNGEWEVKTITSALKQYFRSLPQPLLTFDLHFNFIQAAKLDPQRRADGIHYLVHQLPDTNFHMLDILCNHLNKVSRNCSKNLMSVANLGVCFGPTLMRPQEETIAAIMDIKFCNIVVEVLIENHEKIFTSQPDGTTVTETKVLNSAQALAHAKGPAPVPPPSKPTLNSLPLNNQNQYNVPVAPRKESPSMTHSGVPGSDAMITSTTSAPGGASSPVYANTANNNHQTYAQVRAKLRPTAGFYSQYSGDQPSSTSSSSESLNSNKFNANAANQSSQSLNEATPPSVLPASNAPASAPPRSTQTYSTYSPTPVLSGRPPPGPPPQHTTGYGSPQYGTSPYDQNRMDKNDPAGVGAGVVAALGGYGVVGAGGVYRKRPSADSITFSISSSTSSVSSISSATAFGPGGGGAGATTSRRKVRTLYACDAENESELSFEPNQIITNVKPSREPGWLEGILDGKTGLIPANYVEYLNLNN